AEAGDVLGVAAEAGAHDERAPSGPVERPGRGPLDELGRRPARIPRDVGLPACGGGVQRLEPPRRRVVGAHEPAGRWSGSPKSWNPARSRNTVIRNNYAP